MRPDTPTLESIDELLGQNQFVLFGSAQTIDLALVFDPDFFPAFRQRFETDDFRQIADSFLLILIRLSMLVYRLVFPHRFVFVHQSVNFD